MNITLLAGNIDRSSGGIRSTVLPLAREVGLCGSNVSVLCGGSDDADASSCAPAHLVTSPTVGPAQFSYMPGMTQALDRSEPDVVHTHGLWMFTSLVATRWGRRTSQPRVVSTHGMLNEYAVAISSTKKKIALRLYEHEHLHGADCIHALTEAEHDAIRAFGLVNPVCVIPNGVDLPAKYKELARPKWDEEAFDNKNVLLFLGRLHRIKGLDALLSVWHQLRGQGAGQDWVLVIAGWDDDNYQARLVKMVDELGLSDSVTFAGPQFGADKAACFERCDAFILPSRSEGFPVTVLEAWSYDLPVLMTSQCNIPEGFKADAAIEIEASDAGVANGLRRLFGMSRDERIEMGSRGHQLVRSEFSWSRIASKMTELYAWLKSEGPQPGCVRTI